MQTSEQNPTAVNSSFSNTYPRLQIAWDATSLGLLKTCPRKYFYALIEGWTTRKLNVNLAFGQLLHLGLEEYDKQRAYGTEHKLAQRCMMERVTKDMGHYEDSGEGTVWHPWSTEDRNKTPHNLLRSLVWYTEQFKDDDCETVVLADGTPAVELPFKFTIPDFIAPDGQEYIFCGHLDRIVEWQGQYWIQDRKTTKSTLYHNFFEKFTPDNQMSMYTAAGSVCFGQDVKGVMVDGIQVAVGFSEFQRGFAHRTPDMMDEWMEETKAWIKLAEQFAMSDSPSAWIKNDSVCDLYGGCVYRLICSKDPGVRQNFLASNFVKGQWDPLKLNEQEDQEN